jgi:hypothetical protein
MTREKRVQKLKKDVEDLGILSIDVINIDGSDTLSLEAAEQTVDIIRQEMGHLDYDQAHIEFIEENRKDIEKYIWSLPQLYQRLYFDMLVYAQKEMMNNSIPAKETKKLMKISFLPENFNKLIEDFKYKLKDPFYTKDLI